MWAPSTFDSVRRGRDATWTHPKGATARLDYILCGGDPGIYVADSYVDDQVQTSLTVRDHEMVIAVVHIWQSSFSWRVSPKRGYDWELMNTSWGREKVCDIVNSLPDPPWEMDVHQHWEVLEQSLHSGLSEFFPGKAKQRKLDLFAESTRGLLKQRKELKKHLDQLDEWDFASMQRLCLRAWKDEAPFIWAVERARLDDAVYTLLRLMLVSGFRQVSKQLKAAIKNDKAHFIDQVVGEANGHRGADLYQSLKPLRIGGKSRKMGIPPLPGFSADGVQPVDPERSTDLWTLHCANMEAGVLTSTSRLLESARRGSLERAAMVGDMDIHVVPSLLELEGAFRRVKKRKAGGVEDFKSDLCSLASGPASK